MQGGLAELIISLAAMFIIAVSFLPVHSRLSDTQRAAIAASEIANIRDAASQYISNNWSSIYDRAASPALITVAELQGAGYLVGTGMNPWQQNHAVLIGRSGSGGLLGVAVSYGGNQIPANRIQIAAGLIGKYAAYVPYPTDISPCILPCVKSIGQYWSQSLAGFSTGVTAAYVPTSGHLAAGIFFPSHGLAQDGVGGVVFFASSAPPSGYLKADGAAVSRTEYAALFSVIGTTFGEGDGITTFNVPDLRDEFIRGVGDGGTVGSKQSATSIALYAHSDGGTGAKAAITNYVSDGDEYIHLTADQGVNGNQNYYMSASAAIYGGSAYSVAYKVRVRNIGLLACIKY